MLWSFVYKVFFETEFCQLRGLQSGLECGRRPDFINLSILGLRTQRQQYYVAHYYEVTGVETNSVSRHTAMMVTIPPSL